MTTPLTACVIGGGVAGLSAAVFLDSLGYRVTLLERKNILGGRTFSFQDPKTRMTVDNGQHLLMGAYHETLRFVENIGATRHLQVQQKTEVPLISSQGVYSSLKESQLPHPFGMGMGLARLKHLSWKDKFYFLKLARHLQASKIPPPSHIVGVGANDYSPLQKNTGDLEINFQNLSVREWLYSWSQSKKAQENFWEILTLATLNEKTNVAPATLLETVLQKGLLGKGQDSKLIFPKAPLSEVFAHPAQTYLTLRGHSLRLQTKVKVIHILDSRVQAVELDSGEKIKADLYFSAVPPRSLLNMIPEGFHKIPYFESLKQFRCSPIVSINLWFDREIFKDRFIGLGGKTLHWIFNKNKIHDIPQSPYQYVGVISAAYDLLEKSREEIVKIVLQEILELFPKAVSVNLLHSLVNKEREATLSIDPTIEKLRPDQRSPFSNFYVIGDWTNTGLPATIESAVVSARRAVDFINSKNTCP